MNLAWLPNAICVVRILFIVPLVLLLLAEQFPAALALVILAGASDALDGFLAKTFGWRSRLGSVLDPAADKLLMTSLFVTLAWIGLVPVALTVLVVGRDVLIVTGVLIGARGEPRALRGSPSTISKLNTGVQLGFVVFVVAHAAFGWPPELSVYSMGALTVFTTSVSGLHYLLRWWWRVTGPAGTAGAQSG
jgi:cardiolipin synthase (CMP-forming)